METFYTLDHFYDFIYDKLGAEYSDRLKELVSEQVEKETEKLKEKIDIYSEGFNQALYQIDEYETKNGKLDDLSSDYIYKTKRLDKKIYYWYDNPDYDVEVK
jgi:hypothetical protein